jgi:hypothetical protein
VRVIESGHDAVTVIRQKAARERRAERAASERERELCQWRICMKTHKGVIFKAKNL